ncbi:MAG TPA: penicillin-binding protein 2 [Dictyoglomaceae bacterium]|nr:penicillin-binding protein 2 [Dictyoglomaceae bacterium]HOL38867.1 penicillin-binding protein 2 [Dictyoglomaceae bacterium]HPP15716.1 penicillin-binding protein 2 [Dictyoglomaceae bacterium]
MNQNRAKIFFSLWIVILIFAEGFIISLQFSGEKRAYTVSKKERGIILDRNGEELVFNVTRKSLAMNPKKLSQKEKEDLLAYLNKALGISAKTLKEKMNSSLEFVWIKRILSESEVSKIKNYVDGEKLFFIEEPFRSYPLKIGTSNLLGFVGVDNQGLYGLEASLDGYLSNGSKVYLTLDKNLQEISAIYLKEYVEKFKAEGGFIGIIDLNSGEIVTLASLPDIDINGSLSEIIEQSSKENVLYSLFEPGSLFKIVTTAIALEEKILDPKKIIECRGEEIIDNYIIRCVEPHGKVNLEEAVVRSCNIYFYYLAKKIKPEIWEKYFKLLGVDKPVPLDITLTQNDSLVSNIRESVVNRGTIGFGHGIALTPLKTLWILSSIGNNGYLLEPHIIKRVESKDGKVLLEERASNLRQVFSEETSKEVLNYMKEVVKRGTASNAGLDGYNVAGKTGTAQVSAPYGYTELYNHFFLGYLFLENKKYCILIMLEKPKVSRFARESAVLLFRDLTKKLAIYGRMIN